MGIIKRDNAEYFPHCINSAESEQICYILEQRFGNDGFVFWYKILKLLYKQDGLYFDYSKKINQIYLQTFTRLNSETIEEILKLLAEIEAIDAEQWETKKIILLSIITGETATKTAKAKTKTTKTEKNEAQKIKLAEFVEMEQEEYNKLIADYGEEKTKIFIRTLDNYKGSSGKTYKSDYRAIQQWVIDKVTAEEKTGGGFNDGRRKTQRGNTNDFKPSNGFKGSTFDTNTG